MVAGHLQEKNDFYYIVLSYNCLLYTSDAADEL